MNVTVYVSKELEESYKALQQLAESNGLGVMAYILTMDQRHTGPRCPWCDKALNIVVHKGESR